VSAVELHCVVSGQAHGEAVLLAHAIGCDHRMWDALRARLAKRFRVLAVDLRGHGRSPVPPRPYALGDLAADVRALLDRLGVERTHWVGLSLGGMVGQAFALEYPARLGRLVIANSTCSYGPEGRTMWEARARAVEQGGLAAIRDMVEVRYFSEDYRADNAAQVNAVMERFLETPAEGYLGCCDAIADLDFSAALGRIRAPTLVIAGEADAGTPPAMSQAIAAAIPGARMAVIPGAAHLSAAEKPGEFTQLVVDFLEGR
jgi:3-oxoadipate enol-lactonase